MPGSGKSTIARYLSKSLELPLYDLDKLIEEEQGKSISEIFETGREEAFRILEKNILLKVIENNNVGVISCGGGTPCFFDNMAIMNSAGQTVYIDVPLATLIERTSKSNKRPLLKENPERRLTELLGKREADYKKSQIIMPTNGLDSLKVAEQILAVLRDN